MRWVRQLIEDPDATGDRRAASFWRRGFADIASDSEIRDTFRREALASQVARMLAQPVHFRAASTGGSSDSSVEAPHNDIHNALSFPMMSPAFASFYPVRRPPPSNAHLLNTSFGR